MRGSANEMLLWGFPRMASNRLRLMPGTAPALYVDGVVLGAQAASAMHAPTPTALQTRRRLLAVRADLASLEIERIYSESRMLRTQFQFMLAEVLVHHDVIFPRGVDGDDGIALSIVVHVTPRVFPAQRRAILEHDDEHGAALRLEHGHDLDGVIA